MRVEPEPRNGSITMSPRVVSCRVILKPTAGVGAERRGARIGPDVRPPASAPAQLHVVDVWAGAVGEQGQQLVLGAVEATHAGVGLHPNDEVQRLKAELGGGKMNGRMPAPIDEGAEDAAVAEVGKDRRHPSLVEGEELG